MQIFRRFLSSTVATGGKGKNRFFDAHTTSIWARNMAQRGAPPSEAIQMVLNRMDKKGIGHRPELYNTAMDICGHNGMLLEAAQILHKVSLELWVLIGNR